MYAIFKNCKENYLEYMHKYKQWQDPVKVQLTSETLCLVLINKETLKLTHHMISLIYSIDKIYFFFEFLCEIIQN